MKFAVVLLAFVAAASAQFRSGQYNPFNPFNRVQNRYKPFSTPSPFRYRPASPSVTVAPAAFPSSTPVPFYASSAAPYYASTRAPVLSGDYNAETLKFGNENDPDGSFNYFFETSNGIAAQEQGVPRDFGGNPPVVPVVAQGSFSWTSPEGKPISISYVADENGYQPSGDAIPTPPPVPPQIARALEYIARNLKK